MGEYLSIETVWRLFQAGLDAGCRPEVREDGRAYKRTLKWNVAGRCKSPRTVSFWSSYHVSTRKGVPLGVDLETRCRKCSWCLMKRRNEWAAAAVNEVHGAPRTWFLTLTLSPEWHYRAQSAARAAVAGYDSLPPDKRFRATLGRLHADMRTDSPPMGYARLLTLFIKRVRKNSKVKLRYLLVAEMHKSGLPHFHMLLHEVSDPVRKAVIKAAWPYGFSKVSLCDGDRGAVYLCKYLAKDASTRVRASFKYGRTPYNTLEQHNDSVQLGDPLKDNLLTKSAEGSQYGEVGSYPTQGVWGPQAPEPAFTAGYYDGCPISETDENKERFCETSHTRTDASGSRAILETSGYGLDPFEGQ